MAIQDDIRQQPIEAAEATPPRWAEGNVTVGNLTNFMRETMAGLGRFFSDWFKVKEATLVGDTYTLNLSLLSLPITGDAAATDRSLSVVFNVTNPADARFDLDGINGRGALLIRGVAPVPGAIVAGAVYRVQRHGDAWHIIGGPEDLRFDILTPDNSLDPVKLHYQTEDGEGNLQPDPVKQAGFRDALNLGSYWVDSHTITANGEIDFENLTGLTEEELTANPENRVNLREKTQVEIRIYGAGSAGWGGHDGRTLGTVNPGLTTLAGIGSATSGGSHAYNGTIEAPFKGVFQNGTGGKSGDADRSFGTRGAAGNGTIVFVGIPGLLPATAVANIRPDSQNNSGRGSIDFLWA